MRASFYECDITPPLGGFMWGHYKELRAMDVHQRLYAKAVVIEDKGDVAAIVVVDTCVLPEEIHEVVTKRIQEYTGISPERICIASNHAHTGAPVFDGPEVGCYADETYKDVFFRLTADAVILAYKRLAKTDIRYAKTEIEGMSYCRNYELEDGRLVTHGAKLPGPKRMLAEADRELPFLMFYQEGKPVGAIISYACHQDSMGGTVEEPGYCGDYASILSNELKKHYGNDFVSVFILGACGDVNFANPDRTVPGFRYTHAGKHIAEKVIETENKAVSIPDGVKVIKDSVKIKRRMIEDKAEGRKAVAEQMYGKSNYRGRNMLYYLSTNTKEYSELYMQGMLIGDVYISLNPGEIYTNTGKTIKAESPFEKTIVVENCNSYCGYIPTKECFSEKSTIYETILCYHSCHVPEAADIITEKALELANKIKEN